MALTENLATQNVGTDAIAQASSGVVKGLDAGLAYAQAKQKSDEMAQHISMMKDQSEAQKSSYIIDQVSKASQTDNKSLRKLYMDGADKSFQKFYGMPMSKDIKDFVTNVPESRAGIQKLVEMYPDFASDPKQHALFVANFKSMFNSNLSDAQNFASKISEDYAKIKAASAKSEITPYQQERMQIQKDKMDDSKHTMTIRALNSNKGISDRINQYSNLENSLATITDAKTLTPQQIMEFQQSVRSNLGIKGTGGVEERDKTYINTLGLDAARLNQFLSGDPENIAKDSKLMKHFIDLAQVEMRNISKQTNKALTAVAAGNASMYERRPDLKADLMDKISAMSGRVGQEKQAAPTNEGAAIVKPNPNDAAKQFKNAKLDYAAFVQRAPNLSKLVDEKTYNSL